MSGRPSASIETPTVTVTRSAAEDKAPTFQHCCTATRSASFSPLVSGGPVGAEAVASGCASGWGSGSGAGAAASCSASSRASEMAACRVGRVCGRIERVGATAARAADRGFRFGNDLCRGLRRGRGFEQRFDRLGGLRCRCRAELPLARWHRGQRPGPGGVRPRAPRAAPGQARRRQRDQDGAKHPDHSPGQAWPRQAQGPALRFPASGVGAGLRCRIRFWRGRGLWFWRYRGHRQGRRGGLQGVEFFPAQQGHLGNRDIFQPRSTIQPAGDKRPAQHQGMARTGYEHSWLHRLLIRPITGP